VATATASYIDLLWLELKQKTTKICDFELTPKCIKEKYLAKGIIFIPHAQ